MPQVVPKYNSMTESAMQNAIIKRIELNALIRLSRVHPFVPLEEFADIIKRNLNDNELKCLIKSLLTK